MTSLRNYLREADPEQAGLQVDFEEKWADPSRYTIGHNIHPAAEEEEEAEEGASPYDGAQVPEENPSGAAGAPPPNDQDLQSIQPESGAPPAPGGQPPPQQPPMESIEMNEYENHLVDLFLEELFSDNESTELTEVGPYQISEAPETPIAPASGWRGAFGLPPARPSSPTVPAPTAPTPGLPHQRHYSAPGIGTGDTSGLVFPSGRVHPGGVSPNTPPETPEVPGSGWRGAFALPPARPVPSSTSPGNMIGGDLENFVGNKSTAPSGVRTVGTNIKAGRMPTTPNTTPTANNSAINYNIEQPGQTSATPPAASTTPAAPTAPVTRAAAPTRAAPAAARSTAPHQSPAIARGRSDMAASLNNQEFARNGGAAAITNPPPRQAAPAAPAAPVSNAPRNYAGFSGPQQAPPSIAAGGPSAVQNWQSQTNAVGAGNSGQTESKNWKMTWNDFIVLQENDNKKRF